MVGLYIGPSTPKWSNYFLSESNTYENGRKIIKGFRIMFLSEKLVLVNKHRVLTESNLETNYSLANTKSLMLNLIARLLEVEEVKIE